MYVKFGQMLSTRRDLLSPDVSAELSKLQDKVPPFDGDLAAKIVLKSLKLNQLEDLFEEFESKPLASASIAQVHAAKMKESGDNVVVKVILCCKKSDLLDSKRKAGSSTGAVIEVHAHGVPAGLGAPVYDKLDADLAKALMSINAAKAVAGSGL